MKEKLFKIQNSNLVFKKDGVNPHFKNKYITLDNLVETIRPILEMNKLVVKHYLLDNKLVTEVLDIESEETVKSEFPIAQETIAKPQQVGSAITYGKRYNLGAIFNIITDEDDDGNGASPKKDEKVVQLEDDEF